MSVIERACAAGFEGIAAIRDLVHMQFGTAPDHSRHRSRCAVAQRIGVGFQPIEEQPVANQRNFHRFGHAGDLVARMKCAQEDEIVEHRERRCKSPEQVLYAESIDAVFYADPRIVLAEHGGRHAHMADAAMRGGGNVADHVQKGTAAHTNHERMAVDAHFHQPMLQTCDQRGVVFHLLAAGRHFGTADQFQRIRVHLGIRGDVVHQRRPACRDVGIHEHHEAMTLARLAARQRLHEYRIVAANRCSGNAPGNRNGPKTPGCRPPRTRDALTSSMSSVFPSAFASGYLNTVRRCVADRRRLATRGAGRAAPSCLEQHALVDRHGIEPVLLLHLPLWPKLERVAVNRLRRRLWRRCRARASGRSLRHRQRIGHAPSALESMKI